MPSLPSNVTYGTVVGQFIASVADTAVDPDTNPESIAMGGEIVFTPSVPYVKNTAAGKEPVTIIKTAIRGILDNEGYLCTPSTSSSSYPRGVSLVATDDPNINPKGWTWQVTYRLTVNGKSISSPASHPIKVEGGSQIDLTTASPIPTSKGSAIVRGPAGIVTVEHGTNGATLRPDTEGIVYWIGTARPLEAQPFDWWYSV